MASVPEGPIGAALAATLTPIVREAVADALAECAAAETPPELLTAAQLCRALQVSRSTLHRLQDTGLPRVMLLDSPRYRLADVLAWLEERGAR